MTEIRTITTDDYKNINRYGILNPWGDFWTTDVFNSEQQAKDAIAAFWNDVMKTRQFMAKCKIVPVKVTLEYNPPQSDTSTCRSGTQAYLKHQIEAAIKGIKE